MKAEYGWSDIDRDNTYYELVTEGSIGNIISSVSLAEDTDSKAFRAVLLGELFHNDLHEFYDLIYPNSIGCWTASSSL